MHRYRRYDTTFRNEALALVVQRDRTISQISRDLGMPMQTLWNW